MKKFTILVLSTILAISISACGRNNTATVPTTRPTVAPTTQPTVPTTVPMPTMETNIPDPDINTMPEMTDDMTGPGNDTTHSVTEEPRTRTWGRP